MSRIYDGCEQRGVHPIIPLKETPGVKAGNHLPLSCEHGGWTFGGSDAKRGAAKYRCPYGECSPASVWIKADRLHALVPRESARWKRLYRRRVSVEREFGRLKHEWGLLPLRVRGVERVRLHVDLTILSGWPWRSPRPEPFPWLLSSYPGAQYPQVEAENSVAVAAPSARSKRSNGPNQRPAWLSTALWVP